MTGRAEREKILSRFEHTMQSYCGKNVGLYGLGTNTEYILQHQTQAKIVALMDAKAEGQTRWGLPVLPLKMVAGVCNVIVIVARYDIVPIIYKRIQSLRDDGIEIIDVAGRRLGEKQVPAFELSSCTTRGDKLAFDLVMGRLEKTSIERGHTYVLDKHNLGYCIYGPLIVGYILWLLQKQPTEKTHQILFLARDGYLPLKLYEIIVAKCELPCKYEGIYVPSSRRLLAGAGVFDTKDLQEQIDRLPRGLAGGKILSMRFGVEPHKDDMRKDEILDKGDSRDYFFSYAAEILSHSKQERENYLSLLKKLGIQPTDEPILFDSMTVGTSAYYYRKIVNSKARLFAVVLLEIPDYSLFDSKLDAAYLGADMSFFKDLSYTRAEFLNDSILSAPTPQVVCVDEFGRVVYSAEDDPEYYKRISDVHQGAVEFARDFAEKIDQSVFREGISPIFVDILQGNLLEGKLVMAEDISADFFVVEQFSGKMGKIEAVPACS